MLQDSGVQGIACSTGLYIYENIIFKIIYNRIQEWNFKIAVSKPCMGPIKLNHSSLPTKKYFNKTTSERNHNYVKILQ